MRGLVGGDRPGADDRGGGEPATAFVASAPAPTVKMPPAALAPPAAPAAAPAPTVALAPPATCALPAEAEPSLARKSFLKISSGPTGSMAASAWLFSLSCFLKERQRSQPRTWRRAGALELDQALGDLAELQAHLVAAQLARLGGLGERDARAHEQRLDRRHGRLHRLCDLLVGERVDLAQQQRGALGLGQLVDVGEQLAEALAADRPVARGHAVVGEVDVHRVDAHRGRAAQVVERAVARDPVQPRARVDLALVGEHRVEGRGEDLLQDVLGVLARAEHVAAEGEQARLVARAERLEGGVLAAPRERDQALVGLQAQQRRRPAQGGRCAGMC